MEKYELTVQTVENSYSYTYETDLEAIIDAYAFERGDLVPRREQERGNLVNEGH